MTGRAPAPRSWTRLHPLSPVLQFGRAFAVVVVVLAPRVFTGRSHVPWGEIGAVAVAVLAGLVSWLVTRWRIANGELQIETGLIRRQSIRVPLTRIQAVDVVRPLLARVLGLAELRVVLAGSGHSHSRLAYLGEDRAHEVRAELLALAHGLTRDTPAPPERPLLAVPFGTLVAAVALTAPTTVAAVVLAAVAVAAVFSGHPLVVLGVSWPALLAALTLAVRRVNVEFGFTVAAAPDGLRLRSGLLATRAETIPNGRVQAVREIEPLVWRLFGWRRLEVDVAQQRRAHGEERESAQVTRALLPVGSADQAARLLALVLPGADPRPPTSTGPPRRAVWRAPLSYPNLRAWYDDRHVFARTGRLRRTVTVVPLGKMQSVRSVQGPLQRALRLGTVRVDTAGRGWQAVAHARDEREADQLITRLPELARAARQATAAAPPRTRATDPSPV